MRKIKKIVFLFVVMTFALLISGCGEKKLEDAFEELEDSSYTIEATMRMEMSVTYQGQSQSQTMVIDVYMEGDKSQAYSVSTMNGEKQYSYNKIVDDQVKTYMQSSGSWELIDTIALDEYDNSTMEFMDIDPKDLFKEKDGVWVGDVTKIQEQLDEAMEKMAEELAGTGATIDSTSIDKYNITLDGKHLSKADIVMSMTMSYQGMTMEMRVEMPMTFSKIGETTVTVPEGLPE